MGPAQLRLDPGEHLVPGAVKILLDEDRLPPVSDLGSGPVGPRSGRGVAVHA